MLNWEFTLTLTTGKQAGGYCLFSPLSCSQPGISHWLILSPSSQCLCLPPTPQLPLSKHNTLCHPSTFLPLVIALRSKDYIWPWLSPWSFQHFPFTLSHIAHPISFILKLNHERIFPSKLGTVLFHLPIQFLI